MNLSVYYLFISLVYLLLTLWTILLFLVFYTLLRFDEVYYTGPFLRGFSTVDSTLTFVPFLRLVPRTLSP